MVCAKRIARERWIRNSHPSFAALQLFLRIIVYHTLPPRTLSFQPAAELRMIHWRPPSCSLQCVLWSMYIKKCNISAKRYSASFSLFSFFFFGRGVVPIFLSQAKQRQRERKWSLTYPLLFAVSICSRFRLPRQQKTPAPDFPIETEIINPAAGFSSERLLPVCVLYRWVVEGGGGGRKGEGRTEKK